MAKELEVEKFIIFTGKIETKLVSKYLASSDIYVSTSLSDGGLASSTGEAMGSELPVIVSKSTDNNYWIKHGENGYLFQKSDSKQLAKYLNTLIEDNNLRQLFGERNREIVENDYNLNIEMSKILKIYEFLSEKY